MTIFKEKETAPQCPKCGAHKVRLGGVWSGDGLRPGERGGAYPSHCLECGAAFHSYEETPLPCVMCGADGTRGVDHGRLCEEVTGILEWVPGLPNLLNLCDSPRCEIELRARVDRVMGEAFFE